MRWFPLLILLACEKKPPPPLFQTDRAKACDAFADRVSPSMRDARLPLDAQVAKECEGSGRINVSNYACLMGAKSADGAGACFDGGVGDAVPPASCALYAKHMVGLMAQELKSVMREACMSPQMKEATFDCVMKAKSDPEFKGCLGLTP